MRGSRVSRDLLHTITGPIVVAVLTVALYSVMRTHQQDWDGTLYMAVLDGPGLSITSTQLLYEYGPDSNHLVFPYVAWAWVMLWTTLGWSGTAALPVQFLNILLTAATISIAYVGLSYGSLTPFHKTVATLLLVCSLGYVTYASDTDAIVGGALFISIAFSLVLKGYSLPKRERPPYLLIAGVALALVGALLWHFTTIVFVPGFSVMVLGIVLGASRHHRVRGLSLFFSALAFPVTAVFSVAMLYQLKRLTLETTLAWLRGPHWEAHPDMDFSFPSLLMSSPISGHSLIKAFLDTHTESLRAAVASGELLLPATAGPLALAAVIFSLAIRGWVLTARRGDQRLLAIGSALALLAIILGVTYLAPWFSKYYLPVLPLIIFFVVRGLDGRGHLGALVMSGLVVATLAANLPAWYDATRAPVVEGHVSCLLEHAGSKDLIIVAGFPEWLEILAVAPEKNSIAWTAATTSHRKRASLSLKSTQDLATIMSDRVQQALDQAASAYIYMPKNPEMREEVLTLIDGTIARELFAPVTVRCSIAEETVEVSFMSASLKRS